MANLLFRIGRGSAAKPFIAIVAWLVALAAAAGAFLTFGGTLTDSFTIPGTETQRVSDQLSEEISGLDGASARVVFESQDGSALDEDQQGQISEALASATEVGSVSGIVDPFATAAERAEQVAQLEAGAEQIAGARAEIEAGQQQIDAGLAELEAGQAQLDAGQAQLDEGQAQLDAAVQQAQDAGAYESQQAQFEAQQAELDAQQSALDEQQAQIDAGLEEIAAQQGELDAGLAELEAQSTQVELGRELADAASGIRTVSEDGSTALGVVQFEESGFNLPQEDKDGVIDAVESTPIDGVDVYFSAEIATTVGGILGVGEIVGVALALVVLLVMMRTWLPAIQPIITSIIGVGVGVATALSFSDVTEMSAVTPVLGVMLALAVGIDYSLFIVNRHRMQLKRGMDVHESIGLANGTSGNAVVFAGSTVLIALLALNVTGVPFLGVMGSVAAFCVAIAVLVAVTLTPALLGLTGMRAISKRSRARIGHPEEAEKPLTPMRTSRAVLALVVAAVALAVIAIPSASMRLGLPDGTQEPEDSTQYQAYTTIDERFGEGLNGTLLVTADLPQAVAEEDVLATQVAIIDVITAEDDVAAAAPAAVSDDRDFMAFQVIPREGPSSESTEQLVNALRELSPVDLTVEGADLSSTPIGVAGSASGNIDVSEKLDEALPLYLAVVVGLSLVILIIVFRSLLVPIIATAGFVLSLFAAFGVVTAVYQWGWLSDIFGVHSPGPVLSFLPILLTGILFGLAMDYQLFLTSGMREAYVHGANARQAVVAGMRNGRAVVTAAAIIMASVFGGFIFSHTAMIRPMGLGLAMGVLLDAFVVRMVIVPALIHVAGERAWWLPRWLDRILPNVDVEGSALERSHPVVHAHSAEATTSAATADRA
ncbi:MMPL family transporter [Demequina muriae]|uniref:MMPL family transporter n=1 Tax=Demequina muriae TaxID=3051664 RepID=A0ABT8GEM8_9MICO|nr:MMPL family transporter [Demequina sp. EGI L300058]MDN4479880.1 MMPL family transporter [Demequina sp. EGI L300058]